MAALFFIIIKASDTGIILMVCDIIGLEPSPGLREGCHIPKKKTGLPNIPKNGYSAALRLFS